MALTYPGGVSDNPPQRMKEQGRDPGGRRWRCGLTRRDLMNGSHLNISSVRVRGMAPQRPDHGT